MIHAIICTTYSSILLYNIVHKNIILRLHMYTYYYNIIVMQTPIDGAAFLH